MLMDPDSPLRLRWSYLPQIMPWLLRFLLERDDDHVIYLDPDIQLFSSLEPIAQLAREHGIVLTPHLTMAMPRDGRRPNEQDILMAGVHNLGFIALGAGEAGGGPPRLLRRGSGRRPVRAAGGRRAAARARGRSGAGARDRRRRSGSAVRRRPALA